MSQRYRPFCKPQLGDGALFRFWEDNWSEHGQLGAVFPRLYALAPDTAATVRSMWTGAWTPTLPQALSDQRLADFMSLQVRLANLRPTEEIIDAWRWRHSSFSVRAVYRLLRGQEPSEATALVRRCRVIWKQRLPLATCTSPSDDESHAPPPCSGSYHELPLVRWRDRGLLPPVFHVPDGTRSMADLGGCSSHRIFRRRSLELLQTGDGVEASFRHIMGDLDPQE